ncbi:MAG: sigma-54 dependent transcriptional regulator, partial [Thermodesulfovibrionales bacterium]|nr:sigma-54 dependent transcriptional regulator [Thermodesulfovibrionales bacterium]
MANILYIDDEVSALKAISAILKKDGYTVYTATNAEEGMDILKNSTVDCLLLDYRLPGMNGIDLLRWMKHGEISIPTVMLTAYGTIEKAVEAMKLGAHHYLIKPVDTELLLSVLKEAIAKAKGIKKIEKLESPFPEIIGKSKVMQEVFYVMEMVAESNANVLITGESGTGKELVARAIHRKSLRKTRPFVIVDCTTIPDNLLESELFGHEKGSFTGATDRKTGLIELAHEGTVFLDEIGELPPSLQKKLLRFLQEKEIQRIGSTQRTKVDVRVISATNRDLERAIKESKGKKTRIAKLLGFSNYQTVSNWLRKYG